MLRSRNDRIGGESGAILVLTALLMVVFMGFAALAVDATGAWSTRREAQGAADLSALAGVQMIPRSYTSTAVSGVNAEVTARTAVNAPDAVVDSVDIAPDFSTVTVTLSEDSQSSFSRAVGGPDTYATGATATAEIVAEPDTDKLLPIAFFDPVGQPYQCMGTAPASPNEPRVCSSIINGQLNALLNMRRLNPPSCATVIASNLSTGVDHLIEVGAVALRPESVACSNGHRFTLPTRAEIIFENPTAMTAGLIGGGGPLAGPTAPLWAYLNPGGCKSNVDSAPTLEEKTLVMRTCLQNGSASFRSGLINSPRFGWGIASGDIGGAVDYGSLVPLFLNTIISDDAALGADPATAQFLNGPLPSGEVSAVTVYSLTEAMLSSSDQAAMAKPTEEALIFGLID